MLPVIRRRGLQTQLKMTGISKPPTFQGEHRESITGDEKMRKLMTCLLVLAIAAPGSAEDTDIGLKGKGYSARVALSGLSNPSSVSFSPKGVLTVCDSANGQVLLVKDGKAEKYITGFTTEYWKVDAEKGTKAFKLGPLSSVWVNDTTLAVTNAGLGDGAETVVFFDGPGTVADGKATNAVGPTSDDPKDKGEGNLTGLSISEDGSTIYVGGQGADAKSWVLSVDVATKKLAGLASADAAGIETNSPMATMPWNEGTILALYSGAGGKDDGLIVEWNTTSGEVVKKWSLPGLTDPMGFARVPDSKTLVVVDNNWSLTEVKAGRLARVSFPKDSDEARVRVISEGLRGPVSCAFGPDGDLYIAQLGTEFDSDKGQIIAVSGIKKWDRKKKDAN
jgi:glucose/arabinose dehydrogenase